MRGTATIWPRNWTRTRVVMRALMTASREKKAATIDTAPRT
jgi:hypothetical protein